MTRTIMQHLEEMVSSVEISRGLIENRRKDAEIKLEEMRNRIMARKCTGEAMFDELIERVLVFKNQFSDAIEAKNQQVSAELQDSGALFDEKLDYLDAILDQVNQLQEVETDEENEQRMMTKLRNQCDTIDHKNNTFIEGQLEKYMQEIQASLQAIFDKTPITIKSKSRLFAEFENNPKTQHLSKYILEHKEAKKLDASEVSGQATRIRRMSSKGSLVGNSTDALVQQRGLGTPTTLKASNYLTKESLYNMMPNGQDLKRAKQSYASVNQRAGEVLDIISNEKGFYSSNLDEFQDKIFKKLQGKKLAVAAKPYPSEQDEDPMVSINKKLAAFNLRQRSREMNRTMTQQVSETRHSEWFGKRSDTHYDLPPETCTGFLESNTPNIKDLRDFRQKMRERYTKEQMGSTKGRMVYCTH